MQTDSKTQVRRFWRFLNSAFVSWGVLFLVGLGHGLFRREIINNPMLVKVLFGLVMLLHLSALVSLLIAGYNGAGYLISKAIAGVGNALKPSTQD
jgi:hypothetical protein